MNLELLENALKRISNIERKIEKYYEMLKIENELDFILNGTYVFSEEIENVLNGNY